MHNLPIVPHLESICRLVASNPVTTVISPTGTGKSTGIPWMMASSEARTFVAVPTITSARSLWKYFQIFAPNIRVGYAAEGEIHYNDEDAVVYATAGHVRRKVLDLARKSNPAQWDFCSVLMIDEAHTGIADNRIIQGLWRHALDNGGRVPRLILASATMVSGTDATYTVEEKSYPVQIIYNDKDFERYDALIKATSSMVRELHTSSGPGHFLVFAAGSSEVETIVRNLSGIDALVLPAYGQLEGNALQRIYEPSTLRKIIVATNVAEASITIEGVNVVVDTLYEKRSESSKSGGPRLVLRMVSKDSARQRTGRTGRTGPGICYRMCTIETFDKLETSRPEEIARIPIHGPIMELLDVGLSPKEVLGITEERFREALALLRRLDMVAPKLDDPERLAVTEIGHFSTTIPFGVRMSAALWWWTKGGFPVFPGIVVTALIDSSDPPYYRYPRRAERSAEGRSFAKGEPGAAGKKEHRKKYFEKFAGRSDVHTFLNFWNDLMEHIGGPNGRRGDIHKWADANSMRSSKILEVVKVVRRVGVVLRRMDVSYAPFTTEGVVTALRPIIRRTHSDLLPGLLYSNTGRRAYRLQTGGGGRYFVDTDSVNKLSENPPLVLAALMEREIVGTGPPFHVISVALDMEDAPVKLEEVDIDVVRTNIPRSSSAGGNIDLASALARVSGYLSK